MKKHLMGGFAATLVVSLCLAPGAAHAVSSTIFKEMDQDHDQRVSKDEFLAYGKELKAKAGKPFNAGAAETSFAKHDTDKDGFLTPAELAGPKAVPAKKMTLAEQKKKIAEAKKKKAEEAAKKKKEEEKKKEERKRLAEEKKRKSSKNDGGDGDND